MTSYPDAPREDLVETIHGRQVADPYRWLEDPDSDRTRAWLAAQQNLYAGYEATVPGRDKLTERLGELLGAGEVSPPTWRGERQFFTRRAPGQEHAVLYTVSPAGAERALIDPSMLDPTGVTTLDTWQPDDEGRLLAYQLSAGGREESVLHVMDIATGQDVDGPIDRCRYSDVAWLPGGGAFYYTRRLAPDAVPAGEEQYYFRVYLHQVGAPADEDVLIFGDGLEKTNYYGVAVSHDGRWLTLTASAGTAPRNDAWIADLAASPPQAPNLQAVQEGVDASTWPRPGRDGRLYMLTDRDAPRGRIVVAEPGDPAFPEYASWQELVPEDRDAVLTGLAILDGPGLEQPVLLLARARHAISEVSVHDLAFGDQLGQLELPGLGTVSGLTDRPEGGHEAWFAYTDYTTPGVVLRYDAAAGTTQEWQRAPGAVAVPAVTADQIAYTSADGTTIRMVVVSGSTKKPTRQGTGSSQPLVPERTRPAILYGYGGFNVSLTPAFSAAILAWVEAGGVYAIAGLRGGSEEGEQWHRAGMREHKQNVFDDFRAAAQKLIDDGWTTSDQLTVWGGSNGGLLVGASITQRPDLCAAAVCSGALLDMVRYERFGLGETWNDEFGTVADPSEFGWLISYSPYHHVRPGVRYPAVLFTISDGDTRVDTMHARKMCAAMQYATASPEAERPVLLRNEAQVGHGARSLSRAIALSAETLAFAAEQTGLRLS
ncbi:MAG TPA: prolyl oligopeptidase family serine peptidase [Streptosporangiaceae bacterium]|nr:prolyl oligopeptidase family serine peptidase [Streptosporangiaceae bacterium]